jgi:hypothetical protein
LRAVFTSGSNAPLELTRAQSIVLQVGSFIVLGSVSLGMQAGHWPLWSPVVAAAAYLVWTVAYAEATIQAARR